MVAAERVAVADTLESLDDADWATPSLCGEWSVKEVAAHLIVPFEIRTPAFVKGLVLHRFDFDRANASFARRVAAEVTGEYIVRTLRENRYHPFTPPGGSLVMPLTDNVVHGQDIRRPLGRSRAFESETLLAVLGFLTSERTKGFVRRGLLDGVALEATDLGWSHGSGAAVHGPAEALVMALAGRPAAVPDLEGDGVALLRSRLV